MVTMKQQDQEQFEKAKELLESGTATELGFVRALYFGRLQLERLMPYPRPEEQEGARLTDLLARLDDFLRTEVDAERIDIEERIPQRVIDGLGRLGVLGMTVPSTYGGGGFSHTAYCRVIERICRHCASTAVLVGAHQSIGLKALLLNGTEEQKRQFLPDLAAGRRLAAFCLSEPEVGSDAANVQPRARLSADGTHWLLTGQKRYATNAALAGFMTVMAQTPVEENGQVRDRVTAFIVTPDAPGFELLSPNRSKCGIRGSWQATLRFTDMPVPRDRVLGEVGHGLRVALTVLDFGRCTLSAGCVGGARRALEMAVEHARTRQQFGRPIGRFHLVKQKIARMAELVYAMDAMTYLTAGLVDRHDPDLVLETAVCKLFCSEGSFRVIDDALQIWGGEGYMREHGLERALRDARINRIVEGTTEVMTSFIALMGMKGVGEELEMVARAAHHPVENLGRLAAFARHGFDDVLLGHAHDRTLAQLDAELIDEGQTLARLTRRLARSVDHLLARYRQDITQMQLLQQRVAWSVADMYAMAAVISRLQAQAANAQGNGHGREWAHDLRLGKSFCHRAAARVDHHLSGLFHNRDREILAVADAILGFEPEEGTGTQ